MQIETELAPKTAAVNSLRQRSLSVEGRRLPPITATRSTPHHALLPAAHAARCSPSNIRRRPVARRNLVLPTRGAALTCACPPTIRRRLPLAGKRLAFDGHGLRLGIPSARPLQPAASPYARTVTIKKFTDAETLPRRRPPQLDASKSPPRSNSPATNRAAPAAAPADQRQNLVGYSLAATQPQRCRSIKLQNIASAGEDDGLRNFNPIKGVCSVPAGNEEQ